MVRMVKTGAPGQGPEYIFASSADGAKITGTANLPDPNWNFDVVEDAGRTRGNQKYYDGTPTDISEDRPYVIRFRRPIPGNVVSGGDVGSVAWTQEEAVRAWGLTGAAGVKGADGAEGAAGSDGVGVEYIFASRGTDTKIGLDANLPDPNWNYDSVSASGTTRGTQTFYDGTPTDISASVPT